MGNPAREALEAIPRFAPLPETGKAWIRRHLAVRDFAADEVLFWEGEPADRAYFVVAGVVKVVDHREDGRELILSFFRSGEAVGEAAVIDGGTYPATAIAHTDVRVAVLPRNVYLDLFRRHPETALFAIRDITVRTRLLCNRVKCFGGNVDYRLARTLLILARRLGYRDPSGAVVLPKLFKRQDLADLVSARLETVIRTLTRWRGAGWLHFDRSRLIIREPVRLYQIAELAPEEVARFEAALANAPTEEAFTL